MKKLLNKALCLAFGHRVVVESIIPAVRSDYAYVISHRCLRCSRMKSERW
jgi:hypothetical protein